MAIDDLFSPRTGLLGELEVELQLAKAGWHLVRLDTAQMASNADLIAIKKRKRVSIQVKATNCAKQKTNSLWLGFGFATGYLRGRKNIFNSKVSPLIADVVIGVAYKENASRFVIMPVAFAERLCQLHADYWSRIPAKNELQEERENEVSRFRSIYALPPIARITINTTSELKEIWKGTKTLGTYCQNRPTNFTIERLGRSLNSSARSKRRDRQTRSILGARVFIEATALFRPVLRQF